jgi:hypothetical protein
MAAANDFARLVPGFDFFQGLLKNAAGGVASGLPNMGQWVAPTLNPEELEKRIQELKTVQFWLEQNAKLLATTIQALEVQRMTLSTLKSMNLPLVDLANALKLSPSPKASEAALAASRPEPKPTKSIASKKPAARKTAAKATAAAAPAGTSPAVDPLQWWGALTQQFGELAAQAVKDSATDAAKTAAKNLGSAVVKQSVSSATGALKKAASFAMPGLGGQTAARKRR